MFFFIFYQKFLLKSKINKKLLKKNYFLIVNIILCWVGKIPV